jgi:hypothetical protein
MSNRPVFFFVIFFLIVALYMIEAINSRHVEAIRAVCSRMDYLHAHDPDGYWQGYWQEHSEHAQTK